MKTLKIKDICDKGSSNLKQKDVQGQEGKYPVYGASGVIGNSNSYHQSKEYIAIVKDGSGIGRVSFMPAYSSVIGTLQYILPKDGYNIKYISYCLQSLNLANYKQGAAIPHIYFRDYGEYEVNVEENQDEQQRIVSYLDAEFAKIEALKANAEKQLQAAKDLFQTALKELMTPKEGWKNLTVGDAMNLRRGHDLTHAEMQGGSIPVAGSNGIIGYHNVATNISPCITVGRSGSVGKLNIYDKCWAHNTTLYVDDFKGNYPYFLVYLIQSISISSYGGGSAVPTLNRNNIHPIKTAIPPFPEQQRIADRLDALSVNVKALQSNYTETITLCNDLKQALLKKVFE